MRLLPCAMVLAACVGGVSSGDVDGLAGDEDTGSDADGTPGGDDEPGGGDDPYVPADPGEPDPGAGEDGNHPYIFLNDANRARLTALLDAEDPRAMRLVELVEEQMVTNDEYGFEAWWAALLYQLTGDVLYGDYAVSFIEDFLDEEDALIAAGAEPEVAFDSYLFVGDLVGDVMLTYDFAYDRTTAAQRERWLAYADQAVWNVWNHADAEWGGVHMDWSGWSTNNPGNNYYYSFIQATMLFGLATQGEAETSQQWLDFVRHDKLEAEVFPYFNAELVGGGSHEGTGYGNSHRRLFEIYDFWEASTGERIWDLTPHTRASMPNFMQLTMPTLERFAPIGDQARESSAALFDYHREYLLVLAHFLGPDDDLAAVTRTYLSNCSVQEMDRPYNFIWDFLYAPEGQELPLSTLHPAYWAGGSGQLFWRSSWDEDATWANLTAGIYDESHAHQDQGALMIFKRTWLAIDQNMLSDSGIVRETPTHNLVRLTRGGDTIEQDYEAAAVLTALDDSDHVFYASADVTPMYAESGAVTLSRRDVVYLRPDVFVVYDEITADTDVSRIWQLNVPEQPNVAGAVASLSAGASSLEVHRVAPSSTFSTHDWSEDAEMSGGFRLNLTQSGASNTVFLTVLSLDQAVASATADGPGGVIVTFTTGEIAEVHFSAGDEPGVTVLLQDGADVLADLDLGPGLEELPLFGN